MHLLRVIGFNGVSSAWRVTDRTDHSFQAHAPFKNPVETKKDTFNDMTLRRDNNKDCTKVFLSKYISVEPLQNGFDFNVRECVLVDNAGKDTGLSILSFC